MCWFLCIVRCILFFIARSLNISKISYRILHIFLFYSKRLHAEGFILVSFSSSVDLLEKIFIEDEDGWENVTKMAKKKVMGHYWKLDWSLLCEHLCVNSQQNAKYVQVKKWEKLIILPLVENYAKTTRSFHIHFHFIWTKSKCKRKIKKLELLPLGILMFFWMLYVTHLITHLDVKTLNIRAVFQWWRVKKQNCDKKKPNSNNK